MVSQIPAFDRLKFRTVAFAKLKQHARVWSAARRGRTLGSGAMAGNSAHGLGSCSPT
jgi:hypothetical protein